MFNRGEFVPAEGAEFGFRGCFSYDAHMSEQADAQSESPGSDHEADADAKPTSGREAREAAYRARAADQVVPKGTLLWFLRRVYFKINWTACAIVFVLFYRYRMYGTQHVKAVDGPLMVVSSHQSHFDPVIIGLGMVNRECYALARSTLFDNPLVGFIIRWFNAIPVERGEADRQAIKNCVEVLDSGRALMLFPEGTRTSDGKVKRFKPGVMLIQRKAKATVVPVAIAGAYIAWPRSRKIPRPFGKISVKFGEPIAHETLSQMKREEAMQMIEDRVRELHKELCEMRKHET